MTILNTNRYFFSNSNNINTRIQNINICSQKINETAKTVYSGFRNEAQNGKLRTWSVLEANSPSDLKQKKKSKFLPLCASVATQQT